MMPPGLDSSAEYTLQTVQNRLDAAELESRKLSKNIETFGFKFQSNEGLENACTGDLPNDSDVKFKVKKVEIKDKDTNIFPKSSRKGRNKAEKKVSSSEYFPGSARFSSSKGKFHSAVTHTGSVRDVHKLEETLSKHRRELNETVVMNMEKLSLEYNTLKNEYKKSYEKNAQAKKKNKALERMFKEKESQISKLNKDVNGMIKNTDMLQQELDKKNELLKLETALNVSLEEENIKLLEKASTLKKELDNKCEHNKSQQENIKILQKNIASLKDSVLHGQDECTRLQNNLNYYESQSEEVVLELEKAILDKELLGKELEKLRKQNHDLQEQLTRIQKSTADIKDLQVKLLDENSKLHQALKIAATDNKALLTQKRDLIQREKDKVYAKMQEKEKEFLEAKESMLKERDSQRQGLLNCSIENNNLKEKLEKLETLLIEKEKELTARKSDETDIKYEMEKKLREAMTDKKHMEQNLLSQLEKLKDELRTISEEKKEANAMIKELEIEKERMISIISEYREENSILRGKMDNTEKDKLSQMQFENVLNEITRAKNSLAYEKGLLQEDNSVLNQNHTALQSQYNKVLFELQHQRRQVEHLESDVKKLHAANVAMEKELRSVISQREETLEETKKLIDDMQLSEKRYTDKIECLEASLQTSLKNSRKLATSLEEMTTSHTHVQNIIQQLQTELGRKDSKIRRIESDRAMSREAVHQMQEEMEMLQIKLVSLNKIESTEITKIKKELTKAKMERKRYVENNDVLVKENIKLQSKLDNLEFDKKKIDDKLSALQRESDEKNKRLQEENEELHLKCDREQQKHSLLVVKTEEELKERDEQLIDLRNKSEFYRQRIGILENNQDTLKQSKLTEIEKVNSLMQQLRGTQLEYKNLSKSCDETIEALRNREEELQKETIQRNKLEKRCKVLEQRLYEASIQNDKVYTDLRDSAEWFTAKVSGLEKEVITNRILRDTKQQKHLIGTEHWRHLEEVTKKNLETH